MRRILLVVGVAAVVLVLAELGARAISPYLPAPALYTDDTTAVKVDQLDELDCADIVFAGNSMTRDGLDPVVFAEADPEGRSAYNAALDAATPALLERWVLDQVDHRATPDGVVIGLSSFDLNDEAAIGQSALSAYDSAPLTRDDLFGRLQAPLIEHLDLWRYRTGLRDPEELWHAVQRWRDGEEEPRLDASGIDGVLGPEGQGLSRRDLVYQPTPLTERFDRTELLNDFHLGGSQTDALRRLVEGLEDRGIDTAVVALPVTQDYIDLHPEGRDQFDQFLALAEQVSTDAGADFVDLHDFARSDEWFADTHHLNGEGSDHLSRALPGLLPDDFATGDRCSGSGS